MRRLAACRTAALGGHIEIYRRCGYRHNAYNSCRDRHCPKCQAVKRAEWLESRLARLLPVHYFHVVFTLPKALHPLVLRNRRLLYDRLFQAAAQTLLTLAADPKRLGAQIGITAILHTWGQNLSFHPHRSSSARSHDRGRAAGPICPSLQRSNTGGPQDVAGEAHCLALTSAYRGRSFRTSPAPSRRTGQ